MLNHGSVQQVRMFSLHASKYISCMYIYIYICVFSGEANFRMKRTALKVGGFMQPVVVKGLIEQSQSVEKELI